MSIKISEYPNVSIIILNWNGWKDTIECLESLYQIEYPNFNTIVVDNASNDNSVQKIKDYCEGKISINSKYINYNSNNKPIKIFEYIKEEIEKDYIFKDKDSFLNLPSNRKLVLILNDKNYMFVIGNNIPIKYFILKKLKTDYILLLNNDTVVESGFLTEMIQIAECDKRIGVIGPRVCRYYEPNENEWAWLQNIKNPDERDYISGDAFLIKIELIKTVGLLDSRFIHYIEDLDYCYSARKAGYKVIYVPTKSRVLHKGSVAQKKISGLVLYFRARNYFLFKRKHLTNFQFILFLIWFFRKKIIIEFRKYPKGKKYVVRGVFHGIQLILKDKTLLLKKKKQRTSDYY